ncbi:MAG: metal-dependent transcriptional regulator [Bacillota bacterium]|nr:metal-dependent transcriptional regulator [Bacillota bacterium]
MKGTRTYHDYLTAIYILQDEGEVPIAARVAEYLGVSAPTVSQTLRRLQQKKLVTVDGDHILRLTSKGQEEAQTLIRRHRLLERWLTDILGLDWASADVEAQRLETSVSALVEERLDQHLGRPTTCPHGNPIPRKGAQRKPLLQPLPLFPPGSMVEVVRISELAEDMVDLLRYLEGVGLIPGAPVSIEEEREPGELLLTTPRGTFAVKETVARYIHAEKRMTS